MKETDLQRPHLRDFIEVLIRRRMIVLIFFITLVLTVAVSSLLMYPTYESTTTILIEDEKGMGVPFAQLTEFIRTDEKINTQVMILKSRTVAEKVVKKLGLQFQLKPEERMYHIFLKRWAPAPKKGEPVEPQPGIKVRPIGVDDGSTKGEYEGIFQDSKKFVVFNEEGDEIGKGEISKQFSGPAYSFMVEGRGRQGKSFGFNILSFSSAVNAIQGKIEISPVRNSALINIIARWDDPAMAREIANAVVDVYKEIMVSKRTREASQVMSFIEDQTKAVEKDLLKAEENLRRFKEKERMVVLDAEVKSALEQVARYEKDYKSIESYRKQAEIVLSALRGPGEFPEKEAFFSLGAGLNNLLLIELGKKLADLTSRRSAMRILLKEQHPRVEQIDREIENVKQSITAELTGLISSLKVNEKELQASMRKYEGKIQNLPSAEKELFGLERIVRVGQAINSFLLQKRAELSVTRASELGNFWVVDPANSPIGPAKPRVMLNILLALISGAVLSVGLAFFFEYLDTTVKTPEQLLKITSLPYLGPVFHFIADKRRIVGELKVLEEPRSHVAEAFRTIRTNLLFTFMGEEKKVLLVTSSGPFEGKTFITANLAAALAQLDKKVLIVETDLRKPSMRRLFENERSPGLTNILLGGNIDFSSLPVKKTPVGNLDLIPSGDTPPNPSDLLGSERMERFLSAIREKYDFVLLDTPPASNTSDPLILAQKVDGVIFVARSGEVQRDILKEVLDRFSRLDTKLLGIILNDMQPQESRYYYYKYSYYYYYDDEGKKESRRRKIKSSKTRALPPESKGDRT